MLLLAVEECDTAINVNKTTAPQNQNEQDLARCDLVLVVAHVQKSHMCNNTFQSCITAWRLLTAVEASEPGGKKSGPAKFTL